MLPRFFPVSWPRRFRSSTRTSTSRPIEASSFSREMRAWRSSTTWLRRSLTAFGTSSGHPAASVPGRGEYLNTNALSYRTRSMSAHVASKSASVSPGKAHDDVRGERHVRNQLAETGELREVRVHGVAAAHRAEQPVGAGLDGQVEELAGRPAVRHRPEQLLVGVERMARREADAVDGGLPVDRAQEGGEVDQPWRPGRVVPVGGAAAVSGWASSWSNARRRPGPSQPPPSGKRLP